MLKIAHDYAISRAKRVRDSPITHHIEHGVGAAAHGMYFGSVFIEGHGLYAMMGGVLLLLLVVNWLTGADDVV